LRSYHKKLTENKNPIIGFYVRAFTREFFVDLSIGSKTDYGHEFYLKRNCSISPLQLATIFLLLGIISVGIGIIFYSLGATLILPFSFVEVSALVLAYFYNALHANDYERLRIDQQSVYFESKEGRIYSEETFLKSLTRVMPIDNSNLILISQGKRHIHFGKNIHSRLRPSLEREIRQLL